MGLFFRRGRCGGVQKITTTYIVLNNLDKIALFPQDHAAVVNAKHQVLHCLVVFQVNDIKAYLTAFLPIYMPIMGLAL